MKEKHARQLLDSMELIDDEIIEAAARPPRRRVRAWKVVLPIAACLAVVGTMMVVMMVGVGSEDKVSYLSANEKEWYVRPNGGVKRELVDQIHEGMYLNDVIELIGKPNRPIHEETPYEALQWDLDTGECLHLYCRPTTIIGIPVVDGKLDLNVPIDIYHTVEIIEIEPKDSNICELKHWPHGKYVEWLEKYWENTDEE